MLSADDTVCGFFVLISQVAHTWIDDLCVSDQSQLPAVLEAIDDLAARPWVTCVPTADEVTAGAMRSHGLRSASSYWARSVEPAAAPTELVSAHVDPDTANVPAHTFGAGPFMPDTPGAFVLVHGDGYVIGSPPATTPIFDPGGPTTVIDQLVGSDRFSLLEVSVDAAARRGDAQVVIVIDGNDDDLAEDATAAGFTRVVDLFAATT